MALKYPFIDINGLPRTGSTMLSEAFTCLPYANILLEPHLGKNYYAIQKNDAANLLEHGIDLYRFFSWKLVLHFYCAG